MRPFLAEMRPLAVSCGGWFGVVLDRSESYERWQTLNLIGHCLIAQDGIHQAMQTLIDSCFSEYVLILDDDERCTPALADWLQDGHYTAADFWSIPRAWLYPDAQHYITSRKHWPNPAIRIGRTTLAHVPHSPLHAGWLDGPGQYAVAPYALEHHKLLLRSLEEREVEVEARERLQVGAGMFKQYLPERLQVDVAEWAG
jgi:hypothetical protein